MKREDPYEFDEVVLKYARSKTPDGYKLIMLSVPEPRPWDTIQQVIAVFIRPWHLIAGYAHPAHIEIHGNYYHRHHFDGQEVIIHYLSLDEWVTKMLDGDFDMFFSFRWWARAWFIDTHMRQQAQQMMQYCMSKQTVTTAMRDIKLTLILNTERDEVRHMISRAVFMVGAVKYLLRNNRMARDHISATKFLNNKIVDDYLFARYKEPVEPLISYLEAQMQYITVTVETSKLQDKPPMAYISGSVHQLRLTYALK